MEKNTDVIKYIEYIFLISSSSEELFDAFDIAIKNKISDAELYKILLANPYISTDELALFTEKITSEFQHLSYEIYVWTAKILEQKVSGLDYIERCVEYYQKAVNSKPTESEPLINMIKLYNFDFSLPVNRTIIANVKQCIKSVEKKSVVYYELANLYKKMGNQDLNKEYLLLAEIAARGENEQM